MTQRRVENTRVHFWTFSPVAVNLFELKLCILYFFACEFKHRLFLIQEICCVLVLIYISGIIKCILLTWDRLRSKLRCGVRRARGPNYERQ